MKTDSAIKWPNNNNFAFSIIDDTDVASYERIEPVYDLLDELGFRTTKTVWMKNSRYPSKMFYRSETMENTKYAELVKKLNTKGFEIAFHGASMESSTRNDIAESLEEFKRAFGRYPKMQINHSHNLDNLYWGIERFDSPILRTLYKVFSRGENGKFYGHEKQSPYFWGDFCKDNVTYVRNFCFDTINLLKINPSMPYYNDRCKYVNLWFSSIDAFQPRTFNAILREENIDQLENEGGACILSTHFGKYFVENGRINEDTKTILTNLAKRKGWFVPASDILDYLFEVGQKGRISKSELSRIQYRWVFYKLFKSKK